MNEADKSAGCFLAIVIACATVLLAAIMLGGCKAQREVQVERVEVPVVVTHERHTESVRVDHVRDTLLRRDSVYYFVKGDTVRIERWHYLQGSSTALRVDTLRIHDSVPVPVEVKSERVVTKVEQVEKPLKWWQKLLMAVGGAGLAAAALLAAWKFKKI